MGLFTHRYGVIGEQQLPPLELELYCFKKGRTREQGGLGKYRHFMNAARMLYPKRVLHEWSEWRFEKACERNWCSWSGCASCGKTDDSVFYAFMWWLADPANSAVIMTSTTGKMIRKRGWPVLQRLFEEFPGRHPFNLVDSKMELQATKGDSKHSISGIGVKEGNISKAVGDIQGHHCPRILVIIDEAEETPPAIYDAFPNLQSGTTDFQVIEIANPESRFSAFGQHIEPLKGWNSITVADTEWETKEGICLHFDGERSPNVILGETKYPFLINQRQLDVIDQRYKGKNTVGYYKFGRGFPAPEGMVTVCISESALIRSKCFQKLVFRSQATPIAALDPAFTQGGDKCKLQFGELGDLTDGSMGVNLTDEFVIPIVADHPEPARYQILRHVKEQCAKRNIDPGAFGLDDTSGGVGDILAREWSPRIKKVLFGGVPGEETVSRSDQRPANEAYFNKVTQLWFNVANFIDAGQVGGMRMNAEYVKQFTSRQWEFSGRKQALQSKAKYKDVAGDSPDDADAVAVLFEVARLLGARVGGNIVHAEDDSWDSHCLKINEIYANADCSEAA